MIDLKKIREACKKYIKKRVKNKVKDVTVANFIIDEGINNIFDELPHK